MSHDIYLQMKPIRGESTDQGHPDWMEIDSYDISITSAGDDDDSSGACEHSPISITKQIDFASPKLALAACNRTVFEQATIHVCVPTGSTAMINLTIMEYLLSGVTVLSYETTGSDSVPTDTIKLKYEAIECIYHHLNHATGQPMGKSLSRWDTLENTGG